MKIKQAYNRTKNWWRPKGGFLVSVLLLFLASSQLVSSQQAAEMLLLALMAIFGIGTVGHLINDLSDIEEDRAVGKLNMTEGLAPSFRVLILVLAVAIGYLPWGIGFKYNSTIIGLLVLELVLFLVYSIKPLRLKRVPLVAVLIDSIYAYVNPTLFLWLSFHETLNSWPSLIEVVAAVVWTLPLGLRHILSHHAVDLQVDIRSGSPNICAIYSRSDVLNVIRRFLVPAEILGFLFFVILSMDGNFWLLFVLIISFPILALGASSSRFPLINVRFDELSLDRFNTKILGFVSLAFLVVEDSGYLWILTVFVLLFTDIPFHPIWSNVYQRLVYKSQQVVKLPFQLASLIFNWSLYYFRKWVLRWPEERNWGRHYERRLQELHLNAQGTVAIFNQNFNKYSETFVQGQLEELDYRKLYFYGEPYPINEKRIGNLVGGHQFIRKLKYAFLDLLNRDVAKFEKKLLVNCLINNKVDLIVAHFGIMGGKLTDVAVQSGIPMMVIFHGYDVWNSAEVKNHEYVYGKLFDEAVHVVGVSKDICNRLVQLGCPESKISYLPAYVSHKFIEQQKGRIGSGEITFLYVGRFSLTKAPHLVIEAFSRVVEKIPYSKLIMVGDDDGENLMESCIALVKALRLENRVEFKGALDSEGVMNEMLSATALVQHSITTPVQGDKEGTPVGIMEAMLLGVPIVATKHAGIPEMIEHGKTGLLVEEYDILGMANSMISLAQNAELRLELGENASQAIRANNLVVKNTEVFSRLIDKHKLRR